MHHGIENDQGHGIGSGRTQKDLDAVIKRMVGIRLADGIHELDMRLVSGQFFQFGGQIAADGIADQSQTGILPVFSRKQPEGPDGDILSFALLQFCDQRESEKLRDPFFRCFAEIADGVGELPDIGGVFTDEFQRNAGRGKDKRRVSELIPDGLRQRIRSPVFMDPQKGW